MDKALYTAMTGASASMRLTTAVYHNLANVSTPGFKAALVNTEAYPIEGSGQGLPTRVATVTKGLGFDARQGAVEITGNPLDVALEESVWLAITDSSGNEAYTRGGELHTTANGLLNTLGGHPVRGINDEPIAIPPGQTVHIGGDGQLSLVGLGQGPETLAQVGRLKLVTFGPGQLSRGADGLFRTNNPEIKGLPAVGDVVTSGALESSNADTVQSLVQMIELQRKYESQVQLIKKADENARVSSSLMRLA